MSSKAAITWTVILALFFSWVTPAAAQLGPTVEEARARLVGQGGKEWILKEFVSILGKNDKACQEGEVWRFQSDGRVEVRQCAEGKVRKEVKKWTLRKVDDLDLALKVGEKEYTLLLPTRAGTGIEEMRLRIVSMEKVTPTVDLKFTHERD